MKGATFSGLTGGGLRSLVSRLRRRAGDVPGRKRPQPDSEPHEILGDLEDDAWYRILSRVVAEPCFRGIALPGLPSEGFQRSTVGDVNEAALYEGLRFYREIKGFAARCGHPVDPETRLLDFGCGWGRMIRFFLKDVSPARLYGFDVDPQMTDLCAKLVRHGNYVPCRTEPPGGVPDHFFDVAFAYSVFSHLSERLASLWVAELLRWVKPGGLLCVTTRSRSFIAHCRAIEASSQTSPYLTWLATAFDDDECIRQYEGGEFVFRGYADALTRLGPDYGEALVSRRFVEENWTDTARLIDFVDDPRRLDQVLIVLQSTLTTRGADRRGELR